MSVRIAAEPDLSGYTFYRNKNFDISFSVVNTAGVDTSLYFSNSTPTLLPYMSNGRFTSSSGVNALGFIGTVSVDVLSSNPRFVSTVTPQSYLGTVGVCTDPSGNVYFAHANGNKIYRIDPSGTITTFAGTGTAGDANGDRLTTAQFRGPSYVITDGSGTFYVTDQYRVRKIDSNGLVSTIAGTSLQGYMDATGASARFWTPGGMALRPTGGLLVTDNDYHTVRNVTLPDGVVTTYAGRPGSAGYADGQLLPDTSVVSVQGVQAWTFNASPGYQTSDSGATWTAPTFSVEVATPFAAIITPTEIAYAGIYNSQLLTPVTFVSRVNGSVRAPSSFPDDIINVAQGLATDGSGTYLVGGTRYGSTAYPLVSQDNGSNWVTTGALLAQCATVAYGNGFWMAGGTGPSGSTTFNLQRGSSATSLTATNTCPIDDILGIAYGGGRWVAVGAGTFTLAFSDNNGATWTGRTPNAAAGVKIAYNTGVWIAGFADVTTPFYRSTDGDTFTAISSTSGLGAAKGLYYSTLTGKWFASGPDTIVTSTDGTSWTPTTSFPSPGAEVTMFIDISASYTEYSSNGARMFFPGGLLYDPAGTLYIADQYNNRIRRVASGSSTLTTFAGTGTDTTSNGTLTTAGMARPLQLARDSNGTIYVGSLERNTLQTIIGNNVSLLAGAPFSAGYVDGAPLTARFNGLAGIATFGNDLYIGEVFNADVRKLATFPDVRPGLAPPGFRIIATSNYPITMTSRIDPSWTSVGGSLPLFKFEPFCNTFSAKLGGDTLGYSQSSTELLGYLTGTGTANAAFRGPNGATTAYSYPLVLDIQALSGTTVVDDISTSVTISPARLIVTPCNASLVFYRNEPISPVTFSIVASPASQIYSASTLPNGLTLTSNSSNSYTLRGTPVIQTLASNYTILGQDTSGRTYSTVVSMVVNPERLLLDVSGSTSFGNVVSTTPIAPVTLTARFPPYGLLRSMRYTWSEAPPAGLQFRDSNGTALSGLSYAIQAADSSFSLTLAGTITEAQVRAYAAAGKRTTTLSIVGTRTAPLPSLSPSLPTTLTFTMGQVILFGSNVPTPFVGIQTLNWWYSATSYFGTDVSISSIAITDGFLPDGITGSFTSNLQRFDLSGAPTTASSYGFTLTAIAGSQTASLPISLTTVPDSVFITTPVDTCFNFIQDRDLSNAKLGYYSSNLDYRAIATSGCNATLTATGLPDGVTLDLSLGKYRLSGRPTTATGLSTATLTALVPASGATNTTTVRYSVSAEVFTFDPSDATFTFGQNVSISPTQLTATTSSENPIVRYSSGDLPTTLTITNTGLISGTPVGSADGTFTVTAFTNYSSAIKTYSYVLTDDAVLLQPAVYTTTTAPGANVSIPITGYSLSALTVSNYRFSNTFPYGLSINPTTGLLSGTLASSLPRDVCFTLIGSAGIVDGSLTGVMHTDNLTVNRAQILRNDWSVFFPAATTLRILSSDTNGTSWTQRYSQSNNVYAAMIGTNGSNLYLVPTSSNVVLSSTDTVTFGSNVYDTASSSPYATSIVNKPGTSIWWMVGTSATSPSTRGTFLYTSSNDGATWSRSEITTGGFTARDKNLTSSGHWSPYINGGAALAYKDGVLLLGGTRILRSTNEGGTWSTVTGGFTLEVASFSLDHETVWVAVGSDTYETLSNAAWTGATANTICYSTDAGLSWTYAANGFNMNGYGVVHGGGAWIAYGLSFVSSAYSLSPLVSFDAINWTAPTDVSSCLGPTGGTVRPDPYRMTIGFDETDWKLVVPTTDTTVRLFTHAYDTPLFSGWTSENISSSFPSATSNTLVSSYIAQTLDPGADVTTITFPFPDTGPTFVSPAQSTYVVWQYMPVPRITFTATGSGIVYFVSALPVGLVWDAATRSISGAPMRTGNQTFTVYAKNSGITAFTVTFIVEVPRIVKRQTGAGAYTSLVRQYTEVNAAQTARDSHVLPTESRTLGEFASPYPPSVITPSNCPC
jgi:hypothetical protein